MIAIVYSYYRKKMDDETKQALQELIAAQLGELKTSLQNTSTNAAIDKEEINRSVKNAFDGYLDNLIAEAEELDDEDGYEEIEEDYEEEDDKTSSRMEELERGLAMVTKELETERRLKTEVEAKAKKEKMMSGALEAFNKTGAIRNPSQLLLLLQNDGRIIEKDGQLFGITKDQYGVTQQKPLADAAFVGEILNSEDYAHFAAPRPGTGTGAAPGSTYTIPSTSHLKPGMSPGDFYRLAKDEDTWKALQGEIAQKAAQQ